MEEKLKVMAVVFIVFPAAFLLGRSVGCKIREYQAMAIRFFLPAA